MKVTTINLSPSFDDVGPAHGTIERGDMTTSELSILLSEFVRIDPAANLEHDPKVLVRTPNTWHAIRTERGRLQLYDARDTSQPGVELEREPGANMGGAPAIKAWHTELYVAEDHLLGWRQLNAGRHSVSFVCTGKDARSSAFNLGIDTLIGDADDTLVGDADDA